jgi:hypothetical protein
MSFSEREGSENVGKEGGEEERVGDEKAIIFHANNLLIFGKKSQFNI